MLLFFEVLCAYFAAVGLFFLIREVYRSLSEDRSGGYVCLYVARDGENESDAKKVIEEEDFAGKVVIIYGNERAAENKITDICMKHGRVYIKRSYK
ncbi:MAG TPA: hypothetical protein PLD48_00660 [Bacillota bacterium]|nr:hypothetical protein [Bacillota bacterium]HOK68861.1 hypothetical protein [Bacillota bacterium]HPP85658.1 hypothetical protein [Bacillota bacterium]